MNLSKKIRKIVDPRSTNLIKALSKSNELKSLIKEYNFQFFSRDNNFYYKQLNSNKEIRDLFKYSVLKYFCIGLRVLMGLDKTVDLILFGSSLKGTLYAKGFSDIDICFVLFNSEELIRKHIIYMQIINLIIYAINPFQHHAGFIALRSKDWRINGQGLFFEALENVCLITSSSEIKVRWERNVVKDKKDKKIHCENLKLRLKNNINNNKYNNAFKSQEILSQALTLPCLYFQADGLSVTKSKSFQRSHDLINKEGLSNLEDIRLHLFKPYRYDWIFFGWLNLIYPNSTRLIYALEGFFFNNLRNPALNNNKLKLFIKQAFYF